MRYAYTLQEWLIAHAEVPVKDTGARVGIFYSTDITGNRAYELWHLKDYAVTSVTGGVIWLARLDVERPHESL